MTTPGERQLNSRVSKVGRLVLSSSRGMAAVRGGGQFMFKVTVGEC